MRPYLGTRFLGTRFLGTRFLGIIAAVGAIAILLQGPALARSALNSLGIQIAGITRETYRMPGGFTVGGRVGDPRRYCDRRTHHFVPEHLGRLREIKQTESCAIFWYEDDKGVVRNVVVQNVDKNLVLMESQPSRVLSRKR